MQRLVRTVIAVLFSVGTSLTAVASAQDAPTFIPVQGSLSDDDGTARNGKHALEFRLYGEAEGGLAFYAERQEVEIESGLFTAYLGDGTPADLGNASTSGPLDLAVFSQRPMGVVFLGVTVDGGDELAPRLQLGSVPFAAHAQTCNSANDLQGMPASSFASTDATSLTSGKLDKARLPALSAADISGGTFAASQIPALNYASVTHSHSASDINSGTLDKARIPGLGDVYLERGRFAWGRENLPFGAPPARGDGSVYSGTPKTGSVHITLPNLGCAKPFAWVSANTGGTTNFIAWTARHGELDSNGELWVDWVNLYHTESFHISFDWLAFCP